MDHAAKMAQTERVEAVTAEALGSDVFARFEREPDTLVIPVVQGLQPIGLIERNAFLMKIAQPLGHALYFNRSVVEVMDPEPAVVEAPTTGAAQRAFPGGRARLPTLSRKDTEPELTIVGAAFAREHSNDGSEHHRANSFTEYFSYESLFEPVDSFATPLASPASKDPCGVLGLAPDADHQAIVRAYRKLVKQHHPDRLGDVDEATRAAAEIRLHEITAAYRELQREHQARRSDIDSL